MWKYIIQLSWIMCGVNGKMILSRIARRLRNLTVLEQVEPFTLGDPAAQLSSASTQLIRRILAKLKKEGKIRLVGRGKGCPLGDHSKKLKNRRVSCLIRSVLLAFQYRIHLIAWTF